MSSQRTMHSKRLFAFATSEEPVNGTPASPTALKRFACVLVLVGLAGAAAMATVALALVLKQFVANDKGLSFWSVAIGIIVATIVLAVVGRIAMLLTHYHRNKEIAMDLYALLIGCSVGICVGIVQLVS